MFCLSLDFNYSIFFLYFDTIITIIYLRQTVEDMQAEVDQQRVEDEACYQKQELLREAEETRRKMLLQEEEEMIQQRQKYVLSLWKNLGMSSWIIFIFFQFSLQE